MFEATADPSTITLADIYAGGNRSQIYVIPREGQRGRAEIVGGAVIEIPGERAVMLTSVGSNYDPTFQPDGERIAFTSDRSGVPSLWSMNVDGTDQSQLQLATVAE